MVDFRVGARAEGASRPSLSRAGVSSDFRLELRGHSVLRRVGNMRVIRLHAALVFDALAVSGHRSSVIGHWSLVIGHWSLAKIIFSCFPVALSPFDAIFSIIIPFDFFNEPHRGQRSRRKRK